jgi:hypothetical protein
MRVHRLALTSMMMMTVFLNSRCVVSLYTRLYGKASQRQISSELSYFLSVQTEKKISPWFCHLY